MISSIRKRRETTGDITIVRKPHSVLNIKDELSRLLQETVGGKEDNSASERRLSKPHLDSIPHSIAEVVPPSQIADSKSKHQLYRSRMESTLPFPASPLTSPDAVGRPGSPPVVPCPGLPVEIPNIRNTSASPCPDLSPSIMTQTVETRSLNSSNSKDSSGCQPGSEPLDGSRLHENYSGTSEDSVSVLSPQLSPTSRQKIRRQSTAYDECLNQKGSSYSSARRGSRPFLSPGDEETHRVLRRDSLSPDSAAEDVTSLRKTRRDSGDASDNSRDSQTSPRSLWKRAGRRKSSTATLEEKLNKKKNKQKHSPDSSSSREPSPKFGEGIMLTAVFHFLQILDQVTFILKLDVGKVQSFIFHSRHKQLHINKNHNFPLNLNLFRNF